MKGIQNRGSGLECIIAFFSVRDGVLDYAYAAHRISFREENKDVSAWFRFLDTHVGHELFELALPLELLELKLACARNPFETHQIPNLNVNPNRTTAYTGMVLGQDWMSWASWPSWASAVSWVV